MPREESKLRETLEGAYNNGWKPTGNPIAIQETFPGNIGGQIDVALIYTLAKEILHTHNA